ncbi:hypothetical protein BC940DRAFT_329898 [Gongronella butleri]|nr:hypothetical protein BC940DRAFT_329898 [Gongronella butleri]
MFEPYRGPDTLGPSLPKLKSRSLSGSKKKKKVAKRLAAAAAAAADVSTTVPWGTSATLARRASTSAAGKRVIARKASLPSSTRKFVAKRASTAPSHSSTTLTHTSPTKKTKTKRRFQRHKRRQASLAAVSSSMGLPSSQQHDMFVSPMAAIFTPSFAPDTLDTFCFHWPDMHCYILIRILDTTIALLPVRNRLAFLYFCRAPRPRKPSFQLPANAAIAQPRRIQTMFQSWKHTLAFNDSSTSSLSSTSDSTGHPIHDSNDWAVNARTNGHPDPALPLQDPRKAVKKRVDTPIGSIGPNGPENASNASSTLEKDASPRASVSPASSASRSASMPAPSPLPRPSYYHPRPNPHHSPHPSPEHHQKHHHHHSHHRHVRHQSSLASMDTQENEVTLMDLLQDQPPNACWIHAPCRLAPAPVPFAPSTATDESANNFIVLTTKHTTLTLKARCNAEKKTFLHLFRLNHQTNAVRAATATAIDNAKPKATSPQDLFALWSQRNEALERQISRMMAKVEQHKEEMAKYKQLDDDLEDRVQETLEMMLMQKDQHADFAEMADSAVAVYKQLKKHDKHFDDMRRRLARIGGRGSMAWIMQSASEQFDKFRELQRSTMLFEQVSLSAGLGLVGIVVVLLAWYNLR